MPNLVADPQFAKRTAILAKLEDPYGTDAVPTGALNWIEARDVQHTPYDVETTERGIVQPYMGNGGKLITARWSKLSFWVALAAGGTAGVAPPWGPLALMGGFAETVVEDTSVTYNLVSEGFDSDTLYAFIAKEWQKMMGARAELKGSWTASGLYKLAVEATSLYSSPAEQAMPAVTRTGWPIEDPVNAQTTGPVGINGVNLAASAFDWALGNQVQRISLPGPQLEVMITERKSTASCTVLAVPLSVFNPYEIADAQQVVPMTNTHGTQPGAKAKTDINGKIVGIERAEISGLAAWKLNIEPTSVDGNDEITLTLL